MWEIKLLSLFVIWDIEWDISCSQISIPHSDNEFDKHAHL